jgi:hypothetical protein
MGPTEADLLGSPEICPFSLSLVKGVGRGSKRLNHAASEGVSAGVELRPYGFRARTSDRVLRGIPHRGPDPAHRAGLPLASPPGVLTPCPLYRPGFESQSQIRGGMQSLFLGYARPRRAGGVTCGGRPGPGPWAASERSNVRATLLFA